jgi:hypothetical protein
MRNITLAELESKMMANGYHFKYAEDAERRFLYRCWRLRKTSDFGFLHGPDDNPALVTIDRRTGVAVRQEWLWNHIRVREGGPALIQTDRETEFVFQEDWYRWGRHHRTDGPAVIKYDRFTGAVIYEAFCENGKKLSERFYPENESATTARRRAGHVKRARAKQRDAAPC